MRSAVRETSVHRALSQLSLSFLPKQSKVFIKYDAVWEGMDSPYHTRWVANVRSQSSPTPHKIKNETLQQSNWGKAQHNTHNHLVSELGKQSQHNTSNHLASELRKQSLDERRDNICDRWSCSDAIHSCTKGSIVIRAAGNRCWKKIVHAFLKGIRQLMQKAICACSEAFQPDWMSFSPHRISLDFLVSRLFLHAEKHFNWTRCYFLPTGFPCVKLHYFLSWRDVLESELIHCQPYWKALYV